MNEPYTYEMTPSAFQDLDDALHYISIKLHANESALRLLDDIQSAIDRACRYPHAITPVNDELLKARGYRKLIVRNYLILLIPDHDNHVLNIMRIVYYAKDYVRELNN